MSDGPSHRGSRRVLAVSVLLSVCVLCSGCGLLPRVCAAIGYSAALTIDTSGIGPGSTVEQLCVDDACSYPPGDLHATLPPVGNLFYQQHDSNRWIFSGFPAQDYITIRVFDSSKKLLREVSQPVDWVRTGGSEQCGGPTEATITLN